MAQCEYTDCIRSETMLFQCRYCNKSFCRIHRLPENHECKKLHLAKSPLSSKPEEVIVEDVEVVTDLTNEELDKIVQQADENRRKRAKERKSKRRSRRKKKQPTYETYNYDPDNQFYTTDDRGNVFTAKPSQRIFQDRAFFSLIGDHISVGFEVLDFLIGMLIIAVSWGVISKLIFGFDKWFFVPIMMGAVSLSYVIHIIPQKIVAKYYGLKSRYVLSKIGLILTIVSSISPLRFLSPGVLVIPEIYYVKPKNRGLISLFSILGNLILSTTCLFLGIFLQLPLELGDITLFLFNTAIFASQIAFLGMLPFRISIGKRIYDWNKPIFYILQILTISVVITTFVFVFFV